jgi:hypothetical protein
MNVIITNWHLLYKKHFVHKHIYGQYGQGGALYITRSPKNSHSYMLNINLSQYELCPTANK